MSQGQETSPLLVNNQTSPNLYNGAPSEPIVPSNASDNIASSASSVRSSASSFQDHVEQHFSSPEIVRDAIIGLSDGLTVPFALAAGLSSLDNTWLVVTAGFAGRIRHFG